MNGITAALSGRLTADPESRYTQGGKLMLQLALVVDEQRRGPDAPPTYVRATVWEEQAVAMAGVLERGSTVYLEGRLTLNRWRGQDGAEKSGLNLSVSRCDLLGAVGHRASTGPARFEHGARTVRRPSADHQPSIGRPADAEPPLSAYGEPAPDDLPIDFDAPRTPLPVRQRIAEAAGQGQQRAATRRPWAR